MDWETDFYFKCSFLLMTVVKCRSWCWFCSVRLLFDSFLCHSVRATFLPCVSPWCDQTSCSDLTLNQFSVSETEWEHFSMREKKKLSGNDFTGRPVWTSLRTEWNVALVKTQEEENWAKCSKNQHTRAHTHTLRCVSPTYLLLKLNLETEIKYIYMRNNLSIKSGAIRCVITVILYNSVWLVTGNNCVPFKVHTNNNNYNFCFF